MCGTITSDNLSCKEFNLCFETVVRRFRGKVILTELFLSWCGSKSTQDCCQIQVHPGSRWPSESSRICCFARRRGSRSMVSRMSNSGDCTSNPVIAVIAPCYPRGRRRCAGQVKLWGGTWCKRFKDFKQGHIAGGLSLHQSLYSLFRVLYSHFPAWRINMH